MTHTGGCQCGAIRFTIEGDSLASGACYCPDCQKACGGAPAYAAVFTADQFKIAQGEPRMHYVTSETGNKVGRAFCPDCGTPLYGTNDSRPDYMPVMLGALDDPSGFTMMAYSWASTAQPWHDMKDSIPTFDKNIPPEAFT